jgi:hypothetical protein
MSKLCATMFKLSDITSGGVFGLACLASLLSLFVPPVSLILAVIIHGLSLGNWGFLYLVAFTGLNFFTFKHKLSALLGHVVLILLLAVFGSGFSYLYTTLFFIYLLPYILVYKEATKHNKSSNPDAASRTGS